MTVQQTVTFLGLAALAVELLPSQTYTVTSLNIPAGTPQSINENGFIAGSLIQSNIRRAFVHDPVTGTFSTIGVLPGMVHAQASAINLVGEVVGSSYQAFISFPGRAFRYTPGVGMTDLGLLSGPTSQAWCVDDLGNVGGKADGSAFLPEAFYQLAGGSMQSVVPGFDGTTLAITASGWRVGSTGFGGAIQPFYIEPGGALTIVPLPAGNSLGWVMAVSDAGWLAGKMSHASGSPSYAYRYHVATGVLDNLGSISRFGRVTGVDSQGTVIAYRATGSTVTPPVALISIAGARLVNINSMVPSPWSVRSVTAMNEAGQMCGTASMSGNFNGVPVRLDPVVPAGSAPSVTVAGSSCSSVVMRGSPPRLGRPWRLAMRGAAPAQAMFSLLTLGSHPAVPLPGSGCDLYLSAGAPIIANFYTANAIGSWAAKLDIPGNSALVGVVVTHQALLAEPAAPLGLVATEAVQGTIGQ